MVSMATEGAGGWGRIEGVGGASVIRRSERTALQRHGQVLLALALAHSAHAHICRLGLAHS